MANKLYEENQIIDIANAIREKNGTDNQYLVSQMGDAIRAIEVSENIPDVELTVVDSGVCGESVYWNLYDNGLLRISGQGNMYDYNNDSPFYFNRDILNVVIDYGITNIGDMIFYCCTNIATVSIPSSVKAIGNFAFSECHSLESVLIPQGVEIIGDYAFDPCSNLKRIIIPKSVTLICISAIYNHDNLLTVYYAGTKDEWGLITIYNNNDTLLNADFCYNYEEPNTPIVGGVDTSQDTVTEETLGENITAHDKYGVQITGKFPISEVGIQADLIEQIKTALNNKAAGGYENTEFVKSIIERTITEVTADDLGDILSIGNYAFYYCANLTDITIPNSVTSIGYCAFAYCDSLADVTISNGVVNIDGFAFAYCGNLTDITIPNSVTNIGNYAFYFCTSLTDIYLNPTTPPSLGGTNAIPEQTIIHVPVGSLNAYKSADNWSSFKSKIVEDIVIS